MVYLGGVCSNVLNYNLDIDWAANKAKNLPALQTTAFNEYINERADKRDSLSNLIPFAYFLYPNPQSHLERDIIILE